MAKIMPYTTPDGVEHPESYWKIVTGNFDFVSYRGRIVLYGYHSVDTRTANAQPLAGAVREYEVTPLQFAQYFSPAVLQVEGVEPRAQAYAMVATVLDTPQRDVEGNPVLDGEGNPVLVSFFHGATDHYEPIPGEPGA